MATLRPSTGSVSSLIRSAGSLANTAQSLQDQAMQSEWEQSGYTDSAYQKYSTYLNGRYSTLASTGNPSDLLKAGSVLNNLRTITHQNTSAAISNENMRVMTGQATLTDKANLISDEFTRAQANGDMTLAQSLMGQYYSVSQEIQYQAQTAGEAAATLAKANSSTSAKVAAQQADTALSSLKQLNKDISTVGQKQASAAIKTWLNTASPDFGGKTPVDALAAVGVHLPNGAQPNAIDIAQGVAAYAYNQYAIASKAVDPYLQPGQNNTYEDKANALVTGATKVPVVGGKTMAYSELGPYSTAISQGLVGYNETTGGFGKVTAGELAGQLAPPGTTFNGYRYDAKTMRVQPVLSNNGFVISSPQLAIQANALGLNTAAKTNKDSLVPGAAAQVTSNSPDWLRKLVPVGSWINVALNQNGQLQFSGTGTKGNTGNAVYTIVTDSTGKRAPVESGSNGDIILGGDYGFTAYNIKTSNITSNSGMRSGLGPNQNFGTTGPSMSLSSDFHGVNQMISQAQQRQEVVSAATLAAAKAMVSLPAPVLPKITMAPVPAAPSIAPAPPRPSQLQALPGGNPQGTATNVQPNTGPQLQGGNFNPQGGGGIKL